MKGIRILVVFVLLAISCVAAPPLTHSRILASGAFYELLGMLDEYVTHAPNNLVVERFSKDEQALIQRSRVLMSECEKDVGYSLAWSVATNSNGEVEILSSPVAYTINQLYVSTDTNLTWMMTLAPVVIEGASSEKARRYVAGAYARFGDQGKPAIYMANAVRKVATIGEALTKAGCSEVKLFAATNMIPCGFSVVFTPTATLGEQLGIKEQAGRCYSETNASYRLVERLR